jgi:hypothetical protein
LPGDLRENCFEFLLGAVGFLINGAQRAGMMTELGTLLFCEGAAGSFVL